MFSIFRLFKKAFKKPEYKEIRFSVAVFKYGEYHYMDDISTVNAEEVIEFVKKWDKNAVS